MKYDADIRIDEENTSHAIVVDLVGENRTVLDVGCSTGYLAKALAARGCTVSGIEIDPEAAEVARSHMTEVVVADLDQTPLESLTFAAEGFDVVVFADVLEHLKDPAAVLRASASLLRPGGFVVVSIPNVAHGSVRLALLRGSFEYSDVGLLDDTHIRFFTRETLGRFVAGAGFVVDDMRRTTAPVFGTEIRIDPSTVPPEVLPGLEGDADAETYQFVFTALPARDDARVVAVLHERERELSVLRRQWSATVAAADLGGAAPVIGVVGSAHTTAEQLRLQVVVTELRRRLDGFRVLAVDDVEVARMVRDDPASEWEMPTLDGIVLTGRLGAVHHQLADRMHRRGVKVVVLGADAELDGPFLGAATGPPASTGGSVGNATVPDPVVAVSGLYDAELLSQRLEYLRLLGAVPTDGPFLLAGLRAVASGRGGGAIRALTQVADDRQLAVVLADALVDSATWQVDGSEPVDLLAAVAAAALVVSDDPVLLGAALSLGRPAIGLAVGSDERSRALAEWLADSDLLVPKLGAVGQAVPLAQNRAADPSALAEATRALGDAFDEAAGNLIEAAARRAPATVSGRLLGMQDEVNLLRTVNAGLQQRLRAERVAFGRRAADLLHQEPPELEPAVWAESRRMQQEIDALRAELAVGRGGDAEQARAEAEQARNELQALLATRTFRTVRPAREIYRRMRSLGR